VLAIHGAGGGWDQGLLVHNLIGGGFRRIAVSRFGHLGSPLPRNASSAAQADLYAALLDELGIDTVAIIGTSAGTGSSLEFALWYPDRCSALVLWSVTVAPYPVPPEAILTAIRPLIASDAGWSASIRAFRPAILRTAALRGALKRPLSFEDRAFVTAMLNALLPMSRRADGLLNDLERLNRDLDPSRRWGRIAAPTLIMNARDDPLGPVKRARALANRIPGVEFREVPDGGHLLLGHRRDAGAEMARFIRMHVESPTLSSATRPD
jgi:pimeloyl-ACP methyl ester carboxylesterase